MTKVSRVKQWAERVSNEGPIPKHQNVSFLSLFSGEASKEHAPSNHEESNIHQGRYAVLASLLSAHNDVRHGMLVHHYIVFKGLETSLFLGSHLLHMYFRHNSQENAFTVSASMSDRNVYSWNYLMQAFNEQGERHKPLELFCRMQEEAVLPNRVTFLTIIKAHALQVVGVEVERVHARIICSDFKQDIVLGTALLKVYGEGSRMKDASSIFNYMVGRDVVIWTTMITLFADQGHIKEALHLLEQMQHEGMTPTIVTFIGLLGICAKYAALEEGKKMHNHILVDGLESDVAVGNALINMYGKCASLDDACSVFDKALERNVVTWTSMITLYAQKGYGKAALIHFDQMQCEAVLPNQFTFVSTIVACACRAVLDEGRRVHTRIADSGSLDAVAGAALVNMYDKCGSLVDAQKIFDAISTQDLVLWNALISAYAQNGKLKEAIQLFESMQVKGLRPDKITFSNLFAVCADCAEQAQGERVHAYILESGLELELIVANSLIHMYAHCGNLEHARSIFDNLMDRDIVSWTVMIAAYALYGQSGTAFNLFDQMQQEGQLPDKVTYIGLFDSCGHNFSQTRYKHMHARLEKNGFGTEVVVQNALITLCGKWGNLQDAERIFDTMPEWDVVTWNAMIGAYSGHRKITKVLEVFKQMLDQDVTPNKVTFISVVSACASQTLFIEGKHIHTWAVDNGCDSDTILGTAILTMYGRCGSVEDARWCFDNLQERSVLTRNAMMAVYSQHGQGKEAIQLFQQMRQERLVPDALSFLAVLVACSHAGLADEGKEFFMSMVQEHGILPTADHYGCLIDLFGRVGRLDEAEILICSLPSQSRNSPFKTMLGACKSKDDADQGERIAKHAFELDSDNSVYYVILSNIYSALSKHDDKS
eukprot:c12790_g1_i1 orf=532-3174(+)